VPTPLTVDAEPEAKAEKAMHAFSVCERSLYFMIVLARTFGPFWLGRELVAPQLLLAPNARVGPLPSKTGKKPRSCD
jgi:hypothetical protein